MDQKMYYVVDIDGVGFVFENISYAGAFMADAVEHARQGRYYNRRPVITMIACNYDKLHEAFPCEYPIPTPDSLIKYAKADIQACIDAQKEDADEDPA